jgi:fluoride exporter
MKRILFNSLLVGVGGFVGSVLRYAAAALMQRYSLVLPVGTMAANLSGCLIIGGIAQLSAPISLLTPGMRLLLATGLCGGLTTLSTLIFETAQMLRDSEYMHSWAYLALTIAGAIFCFYLGGLLIRLIYRSPGGIWN